MNSDSPWNVCVVDSTIRQRCDKRVTDINHEHRGDITHSPRASLTLVQTSLALFSFILGRRPNIKEKSGLPHMYTNRLTKILTIVLLYRRLLSLHNFGRIFYRYIVIHSKWPSFIAHAHHHAL